MDVWYVEEGVDVSGAWDCAPGTQAGHAAVFTLHQAFVECIQHVEIGAGGQEEDDGQADLKNCVRGSDG